MLVVRLDSVLEDIIRYETETSGLEATSNVLKRLDTLEKKVDVDLLQLSNDNDEDDEDKVVENRRRNSCTLKNVCLQAIQTFTRPSEADIIKRCKVNAILSLRSEDPFEKFIQQAVEHTMRERTQPILEILDMLEQKVDEYGRQAVMAGVAAPIPKALSWHESELAINTDSTNKQNKQALVVTDKKVDVNRSQQMIVRITSWRCHTTDHPDPSKIYLDLTKKRVEFLVEAKVRCLKD